VVGRKIRKRPRSRSTPLVSVVVPAYNAGATLCETLKSALAQTYENIEIIVVDDGSTDRTPKIVREMALEDGRIQLIRQTNAGVAAARNTGIQRSAGDFIAPLDADDLWHPSCIEKRMAVLLSGGSEMAAVYAGHRIIDEDSRVISSQPIFRSEGNIFGHLLCVNVVGNGSSLLMRKDAVLAVGAFESWLRAAGAEGCEDSLLQFRLASKYNFGCVAEYLIGYRKRPGNMSSDFVRMFDSSQRVFKQVEATAPDWLKPLARRRAAESLFFSGYNMLKRGQFLRAAGTIGRAHTLYLGCGLECCTHMVVGKILSLRRWNTSGTSVSRHFDEYDPKDGEHSSIGYVARRRFAWIAAKGPQTDTQYVEQLPLATARKVGVSGVSERA
jgi:glycosyltransferase involved in cell wall biosynthesis